MFNDCNNPVVYDTYFGPINEKIFNNFVSEKLSKHINAYPAAHSIIMVDNCSFHHNPIFEAMIEELGAILLFLPAYKPNWNITEYYFNGIKAKEQMKPMPQNENAAIFSLMESVNAMRGSNWRSVLKKIGYIA